MGRNRTETVEINNIRILRVEMNMNQTELGSVIGLRHGAIGNYERGGADPSVEDLIKLADFFDVSIDYLLKRTQIRRRPETILECGERGITLMEDFNSLPDDAKQKVEDIFTMVKAYYKNECK